MDSNFHNFEYAWFTPGSSKIWDCDGLFTQIDYKMLPNVPHYGDDLSWLDEVSIPHPYTNKVFSGPWSGEKTIDALLHSKSLLINKGFQLPENFELFVTNHQLHFKMLSCADYGFSIPENPIQILNDGRMCLPFLNDGQNFMTWYLLFDPNASTKVLATPLEICPDFRDPNNDLIDPEEEIYYCYICADSFSEFIYRFWIENAFWYSEKYALPLTKRQLDYKNQIVF